MKILCSRNSDTDLDRFIGKDIWVLMEDPHVARYNARWVRVLDYMVGPGVAGANTKMYIVNDAPQVLFEVSEDNRLWTFVGSDQVKQDCLTWKQYPLEGQLHIVHPLEIRTTEELFGE